jgi:hypothetical protein
MAKITFELDSETVDKVIVEELIRSRISLLEDYENGRVAVFDVDPEEDRKQIGAMIKAIEKVIDWYSVPGMYEFDELPQVEPVPYPDNLGN